MLRKIATPPSGYHIPPDPSGPVVKQRQVSYFQSVCHGDGRADVTPVYEILEAQSVRVRHWSEVWHTGIDATPCREHMQDTCSSALNLSDPRDILIYAVPSIYM